MWATVTPCRLLVRGPSPQRAGFSKRPLRDGGLRLIFCKNGVDIVRVQGLFLSFFKKKILNTFFSVNEAVHVHGETLENDRPPGGRKVACPRLSLGRRRGAGRRPARSSTSSAASPVVGSGAGADAVEDEGCRGGANPRAQRAAPSRAGENAPRATRGPAAARAVGRELAARQSVLRGDGRPEASGMHPGVSRVSRPLGALSKSKAV